jgi:ArsR family metal-binding transcriptional regulator
MKFVTTFPEVAQYRLATAELDRLSLPYETIDPGPAYRSVAVPALIVAEEARAQLLAAAADLITSGWVDYKEPNLPLPSMAEPEFTEDIVGRVAVVVLSRCGADPTLLRLIAHVSGDLGEVLPYVNAELVQASFVPTLPVLTLMDGRRLISVFRDRIAVAKADDITDAWASFAKLRNLLNDTWSRRDGIEPSFDRRRKPPVIEVYRRLPGTNCKACGEPTCMAFASSLWRGEADPARCQPVFTGNHQDLMEPLLQICAGLGI